MSEQESDAERHEQSPARAFEWVMREVEMPSRAAGFEFREAFLGVLHEGHSKVIRVLENAWPDGARWPSGETYLRKLGWRAPYEFADDEEADAYTDEYDGPELMELLYERLQHVEYRLFRDAQVRSVLDPASPRYVPAYTHALLNRNGDFRGDPCGHGVDKVISIDEALRLMEQPAHVLPACCCTVDPFPVTFEDRDRLTRGV